MKRTKIVCTIGPASESRAQIKELIKAGLNVARLNFSHNVYQHHRMLIKNIRSAAAELKRPVAIMQDLQGPRIRIGEVGEKGVKVTAGQKIFLVQESFKTQGKKAGNFIPVQYPNLYRDIKPGEPILIDDAKIELQVLAVKNKMIECQVKVGETINTHKGMNFPKSDISLSAITAKDKADLEFGIKQGVDFIALSFVKDDSDIIALRRLIATAENRLGKKSKDYKKPKRHGNWPMTQTKIIAKIERPQAVKNFEKILAATDGVMVARGDLGLEMPLENLPLTQKKIVRRCIQEAKPVIVATQMLDSMIRFPIPTRAEVSDVANAILDGTDAIMLSGETATGKYPLKAVQVMERIASEVEGTEIKEHERLEFDLKKSAAGITETTSYAVQDIAEEIKAKLIVCATTAGFTARAIAKYRSVVPLIALTPSDKTKNQLCLSWGVTSYQMPFNHTFDQLLLAVKKLLNQEKLVKKGDVILIAAAHPFGFLGQTNLVKVEVI